MLLCQAALWWRVMWCCQVAWSAVMARWMQCARWRCGWQGADELPDGGVQVAGLAGERGDLSGHASERRADVRAELRRAGEGRDHSQVLSPGEVLGGVVEPDVQLRLELVDDHGAALDEVGPVVD